MIIAALACRFILGATFCLASVPKILARSQFARAVANYRLLPSRVVVAVAAVIPLVELVCATALFAGFETGIAALVIAIALVIFAVAVSVNLLRGRVIACGCAGGVAPKRITWHHVVSNLVLCGAAVFVVLAPDTAETISAPWTATASSVHVQTVLAVLLVSALVPLAANFGGAYRDARTRVHRLTREAGA